MNDDDKIQDISRKIEREKALINAANLIRQQTSNDSVRSKLDTQMREGRRNLEFFENRLQELQMRKMNRGVDNLSLGGSSSGSPYPGGGDGRGPQPPPKDGGQGGYGDSSYGQHGQAGPPMPSGAPFPGGPPGSAIPKARPNFSKLGTFASVLVGVMLWW